LKGANHSHTFSNAKQIQNIKFKITQKVNVLCLELSTLEDSARIPQKP